MEKKEKNSDIDPFVLRLNDAVSSPEKVFEYDQTKGALKLAKPEMLSELKDPTLTEKTVQRKMSAFGFKKKRIDGVDYFFNAFFRPNDRNSLSKVKNRKSELIKKRKKCKSETGSFISSRKASEVLETSEQPQLLSYTQPTFFGQQIVPDSVEQLGIVQQQPLYFVQQPPIIQGQREALEMELNMLNERVSKLEAGNRMLKNLITNSEYEMLGICQVVDEITENGRFH
ncbi:hypothetical protein EIN_080950 [Entamoeba invadens IP1]|uniref:hypothetical protein n=1 Tax=Entamoeba invadens IP1 TaxID=370355 RepID=UPI0002C3CE14|nr:hypothetical protein EIN_080950 [Entamoeba invadens IP1]ELP85123.1 hypothetical protein EIN_080950 [Entamoeba invadens IP1]|eukprot:XP_004184469.1 hypothetical protein EIN_080950 [Entamoeba invadens IP1]